jgi:hypothetical protein
MSAPLSIEERITRIDVRLTLVATVLSEEIDDPHEDPQSVLSGLRQLLVDVADDLEPLKRLPFSISEWRCEA